MTKSLNNTQRHPLIRGISVLLLFFYVYNTPLLGFPKSLTTIRLTTIASLFFAFVVSAIYKQPVGLPKCYTRKAFRKLIFFQFILFVYVLGLLSSIGLGDGSHIVFSIINTFLFSFIPVLSFIILFNNIEDFMKALIWITIFQTIAVWLCMISPSIAQLVDTLFPPTEFALEKDLRDGYAGGIQCIAAPGVFKYALGIMSCIYFIVVKQQRKYYLLLLLFGLTSSLIARTGLIITASVFFFIFFDSIFNSHFHLSMKNVGILFLVVFAVIIILYVVLNSPFMREQFARMEFLFEVGAKAGFFNAYFEGSDTIIPPITSETLIGTGITSGRSGNGIYVNADGGYIKVYAAYGLILAIIFYVFLYSLMIGIAKRFKDKSLRFFVYLFIMYIAAAEFKEYVIYDMYMLCVFFIMTILLDKEQKLNLLQLK